MAVLEVQGISKKFKRKEPFYALKDVSLSVDEGEIFAVLGPNGAGKTTMLNIVMGIVAPDSGKVMVLGRDAVKARNGILGYVSGDERFHWTLTVNDILRFGGILNELGKEQRKKRIKELVGLFGLQDVVHSRFNVLSTGERMRLAFAYALISNPKVLLLDEPTLGLDPDIAIRIRKEIRRINKELNTTIVLTSHYMAEVEELADRMVFLHKGVIQDRGTIREIREKYPNLESYFVKMVEG